MNDSRQTDGGAVWALLDPSPPFAMPDIGHLCSSQCQSSWTQWCLLLEDDDDNDAQLLQSGAGFCRPRHTTNLTDRLRLDPFVARFHTLFATITISSNVIIEAGRHPTSLIRYQALAARCTP